MRKDSSMYRWRMGTAALAVLSLLAVTAGGASAKTHRAAKFDPTCGPKRAQERVVNGTLGSVTIHGTPRRIVALEFSFVDDLTQVGLKPIGLADDNTSVGLRATPNLETIASLHPDLIIADATRHVKI